MAGRQRAGVAAEVTAAVAEAVVVVDGAAVLVTVAAADPDPGQAAATIDMVAGQGEDRGVMAGRQLADVVDKVAAAVVEAVVGAAGAAEPVAASVTTADADLAGPGTFTMA